MGTGLGAQQFRYENRLVEGRSIDTYSIVKRGACDGANRYLSPQPTKRKEMKLSLKIAYSETSIHPFSNPYLGLGHMGMQSKQRCPMSCVQFYSTYIHFLTA